MAQFTKKITPVKSHGQKVMQLTFKSGNYTREAIRKAAQKIGDDLKEKGAEGSLYTALKYPEGWKPGYYTPFGDKIDLYSFGDYDDEEGNDPLAYPTFVIFIVKGPKVPMNKLREGKRYQKKGGNSESNDCLYFCLMPLIPNFIKEFPLPISLKRWLGLKPNEKISIDLIEKIEQEFPDYNIHVSGDYEYQSKNKGRFDFFLKLLEEHYSIDKSKLFRIKGIADEEKKPLIVKLSKKNPERMLVFDGV